MKRPNCSCFLISLLASLWLVLSALSPAYAGEPKKETGMASIMTLAPQMTPFSDYRSTKWSTATSALGVCNFGAKRQELYEKGIAIDGGLTNVFQGVVSGGANQTWQNTIITDQQISLDTGRLGLWSGGLIVIHGRSKFGNNVLSEAGTLSPVNDAALTPESSEADKWFLEEYYLFQALSEKWSVVAGRVLFSSIGDLNRFAGNEKTQFLNVSLRNSPLLGIISQATSWHGAAVN